MFAGQVQPSDRSYLWRGRCNQIGHSRRDSLLGRSTRADKVYAAFFCCLTFAHLTRRAAAPILRRADADIVRLPDLAIGMTFCPSLNSRPACFLSGCDAGAPLCRDFTAWFDSSIGSVKLQRKPRARHSAPITVVAPGHVLSSTASQYPTSWPMCFPPRLMILTEG